MAKHADEIQVTIKFSLWLKYYLWGVDLISQITGLDPDIDKVGYWISRGIKIAPVRGGKESTMKILAAALLLTAVCSTAMAAENPRFPADLHKQPEKFCLVAGVMSAGIMERINVGYRPEAVYEEMSRVDQYQLRIYLNETVTLAQQFAINARGYVSPKQFAQWRYKSCIGAMAPKAHEVYEMVDGKSTRVQ